MKNFKRIVAIMLVIITCSNSFAAVVSDNDGSAFITKAEFDSLKNSFQAQIDSYNSSIDSKIDGAIAAYLSGVQLSTEFNEEKIMSNYDTYKFKDNLNVYINLQTASGATKTQYDVTNTWGTCLELAPAINWRPQVPYRDNIYYGVSWQNYRAVGTLRISYEFPAKTSPSIDSYISSFVGLVRDDSNNVLLPTIFLPMASYNLTIGYNDVTAGSRIQNKFASDNGLTIGSGGIYRKNTYDYHGLFFSLMDGIKSDYPKTSLDFVGTAVYPEWTYGRFRSGIILMTTSNSEYYPRYENHTTFSGQKIYPEFKTLILSAPSNKKVFTGLYESDQITGDGAYNYPCEVNKKSLDNTINATIKEAYWDSYWTSNTASYPQPSVNLASGAEVVYPAPYKLYNFYELINRNSNDVGYPLKFGDGVPLARASINGVMKINLKTTRTSGTASSNRLTLKIGSFNNEVGNGNTLRVCNRAGVEGDYAVDLIPISQGDFEVFVKVNSGDVVYCRVSPQDNTGKISASISDYTCTTYAD